MTRVDYAKAFPDAALDSERLRGCYTAGGRKAEYLRYHGAPIDSRFFEFLTGCLLGDGSLAQHGLGARYTDAQKNGKYARWKFDVLTAYVPTTMRKYTSPLDRRTGHAYTAHYLKTGVHPVFLEWRKRWYATQKRVPIDLVKAYLTPFAFAVWVCDDGHNARSSFYLYPLAFEIGEVDALIDIIRENLGLHGKRYLNTARQPYIRFLRGEMPRVRDLMNSMPLPGMAYKSVV
jgi:hypothetical protein